MEADKAKTLVQESWALVQADLDTHGIKFFKKIFEIAPGALELFKSFKGTYLLVSSFHRPRYRKLECIAARVPCERKRRAP
jgi:hypothetical protein